MSNRRGTESEAWLRVAQYVSNARNPMPFGLCWVFNGAFDMCDTVIGSRMYTRCMTHIRALQATGLGTINDGAYQWGTEREARCLAALWMSLEAAEESRRLSGGDAP